jgi:hypothetical protein
MLTSLVSLLPWRAETLKYETRFIDDLMACFTNVYLIYTLVSLCYMGSMTWVVVVFRLFS